MGRTNIRNITSINIRQQIQKVQQAYSLRRMLLQALQTTRKPLEILSLSKRIKTKTQSSIRNKSQRRTRRIHKPNGKITKTGSWGRATLTT